MTGRARDRALAIVLGSLVAVAVHFPMHYLNLPVPGTAATGQNPGVAAAVGSKVGVAVGPASSPQAATTSANAPTVMMVPATVSRLEWCLLMTCRRAYHRLRTGVAASVSFVARKVCVFS